MTLATYLTFLQFNFLLFKIGIIKVLKLCVCYEDLLIMCAKFSKCQLAITAEST